MVMSSQPTTMVLTVPEFRVEDYLPTFSGEPEEDVEILKRKVEDYFGALDERLLNDRLQVLVIHRQLKGVALKNGY